MREPLGQLAQIHYGKSPSDVLSVEGEFPIVGTGGVYGNADRAMFDSGIVVARKGSLGTPHLFHSPFWPVDTVYAVIPKHDVDTTWLYYCLLNFDLTKLNEATGVPSISRDWLSRIAFQNPGYPKQKKIGAIIAAIDSAIEKTEALIKKYQQIKAGLMHDLFTRGVLPNGQLRPSREHAAELYQETAIGWIPKEWSPMSLKALVGASNIVNGPFGSDLLTSELKAEGVPVLYVQDVKPGEFVRVSSANVTKQKALELSFCDVRHGDVLVAKVGSPPCDSCVYLEDEKGIVTQDVIRIRPIQSVDSAYLSALINSSVGRKSIKRIAIEGTRERVSLTEFKQLTFPIATPEEQAAIGKRLNAAQAMVVEESRMLDKLRKEKLGLMQDLLTGKVQVKVDNNVAEPTSG